MAPATASGYKTCLRADPLTDITDHNGTGNVNVRATPSERQPSRHAAQAGVGSFVRTKRISSPLVELWRTT